MLLEHQRSEDWWMLERVFDTKRMMWSRWRRQRPEAWHLPMIMPLVARRRVRRPVSAAP